MTDQTPPPFLPISDEEGYYVRDPGAVLIRTDEQFRTFAAHLLALTEGVANVDASIPPEQQALAQQIKSELAALQGSTKLLTALLRELAAYNIKLTQQRQSARTAFNAGWQARYKDILSQLHPVDHRMLRWVIEHIDDDGESIPF